MEILLRFHSIYFPNENTIGIFTVFPWGMKYSGEKNNDPKCFPCYRIIYECFTNFLGSLFFLLFTEKVWHVTFPSQQIFALWVRTLMDLFFQRDKSRGNSKYKQRIKTKTKKSCKLTIYMLLTPDKSEIMIVNRRKFKSIN